MRVTEQIDALEIMGINSKCYLILPKIIAAVFINPFLIVISMFLSLLGGLVAGVATGAIAQGVLVAEAMGLPFVYIRSSAKEHGMGR